MMDDLVAYSSYPNSRQGDITLKGIQDMVAQMDKYVRYPKRRGVYDMDWPSLPPDFKPKEKKKEQ
jgi:hypothetical protein